MITSEREFLKCHERLERLVETVKTLGEDGSRIDEVERTVFAELLQMGFHLLSAFVRNAGDGDVGETIQIPAAEVSPASGNESATAFCTWQRLPEPHCRSYVSIFGKLTLSRWVYGTRNGQKIQVVPLDARLGLPAGDFSYVLEDWQQRICLKESFAEATENLADLLGIAPSVRAAEVMSRKLADFVPTFREDLPIPPAHEEGELIVFTADGKGIPMRRDGEPKPSHGQRRGKGEKANKKQMSYVGAVYTVERFPRTPDEVLDELARKERTPCRPRPQHKHVAAEMTRVIEGEECNGRVSLFGMLSGEVEDRNRGAHKTVIAVMDGERALWDVQDAFLPKAVGILDLFHVTERLWNAAHVFHPEKSREAEKFVTDRLRMLLEGKVGGVIGGLKQMLRKNRLSASKRRALATVIGYFENNRHHMQYDEYLAAGYPIGSGVAEGACRHLVKDRMEQTGMRWTVTGAQALLHLRAVYLNGDWQSFLIHRIEQEQNRIYPYKHALAL
ncbi:MAG: ISKra4 family transposase [Anaerobacillus sp.]